MFDDEAQAKPDQDPQTTILNSQAKIETLEVRDNDLFQQGGTNYDHDQRELTLFSSDTTANTSPRVKKRQ